MYVSVSQQKKKKKTLEGYLSDSYKYDLSSFAAAS